MTDPVTNAPAPQAGQTDPSASGDLAQAFKKLVDSFALGIVENNKPQIHDSDDGE
jgi:hypothetical protein